MDPNASMESGDQEFQVGGRFLTFFSIFDSSFYASLNLMIQYILQTPYNTLAGVELLQKCQRKWEEEPPDLSLTLIVKASKIKVAYSCAIYICLTRFLSLFLFFFFLDPNEYQRELTIPLLTLDVNSPKFCRQRRET